MRGSHNTHATWVHIQSSSIIKWHAHRARGPVHKIYTRPVDLPYLLEYRQSYLEVFIVLDILKLGSLLGDQPNCFVFCNKWRHTNRRARRQCSRSRSSPEGTSAAATPALESQQRQRQRQLGQQHQRQHQQLHQHQQQQQQNQIQSRSTRAAGRGTLDIHRVISTCLPPGRQPPRPPPLTLLPTLLPPIIT